MTRGPLLPNLAALALIIGLGALAYVLAQRRYGRSAAVRFLPAIILVAIFAVITHLPWPGPEWRGCGNPKTDPLFTPLRFFDAIGRHWARDATLGVWLEKLFISPTALNLHACIAIGAALALCVWKVRHVVLIGAAMTACVELSQVTGFFGLAPCPWRQFDVDDLILNLTGVVIGYTIARFAGLRPFPVSKRP